MTLAYVFWHAHVPEITAQAYQERLIQFHQTLAEHKPGGFLYSRLLLAEQAAWLGRSEPTYEDWNIVEHSAALDPLNDGAVTGACLEPHQQVARWTAWGTGGLYHLVSGTVQQPAVRFAWRFNKPAGMSYAELYALLQPYNEQAKGNLWARRMSLGAGPEFCLHSTTESAPPDVLQALKIPVQQIWMGQ